MHAIRGVKMDDGVKASPGQLSREKKISQPISFAPPLVIEDDFVEMGVSFHSRAIFQKREAGEVCGGEFLPEDLEDGCGEDKVP